MRSTEVSPLQMISPIACRSQIERKLMKMRSDYDRPVLFVTRRLHGHRKGETSHAQTQSFKLQFVTSRLHSHFTYKLLYYCKNHVLSQTVFQLQSL